MTMTNAVEILKDLQANGTSIVYLNGFKEDLKYVLTLSKVNYVGSAFVDGQEMFFFETK